jgi:hypothetical protein
LEPADDVLLPWWEGAVVDAARVGGAVEKGLVCNDLLRRFFGMDLVFLKQHQRPSTLQLMGGGWQASVAAVINSKQGRTFHSDS